MARFGFTVAKQERLRSPLAQPQPWAPAVVPQGSASSRSCQPAARRSAAPDPGAASQTQAELLARGTGVPAALRRAARRERAAAAPTAAPAAVGRAQGPTANSQLAGSAGQRFKHRLPAFSRLSNGAGGCTGAVCWQRAGQAGRSSAQALWPLTEQGRVASMAAELAAGRRLRAATAPLPWLAAPLRPWSKVCGPGPAQWRPRRAGYAGLLPQAGQGSGAIAQLRQGSVPAGCGPWR